MMAGVEKKDAWLVRTITIHYAVNVKLTSWNINVNGYRLKRCRVTAAHPDYLVTYLFYIYLYM